MIGPVIGHLGPRVSALLDGQMSAAEEERAWDHVHSCHQCRDAVEREGWVKTRLATMQYAGSAAPSHLKCSLLFQGIAAGWDPHEDDPSATAEARSRRHLGMAGISTGAVGAAVMGVLALGASPANAPGAIVRPSGESFGTSLTNAITTIVDHERLAGSRAPGSQRQDAPPLERALGRTLAQ